MAGTTPRGHSTFTPTTRRARSAHATACSQPGTRARARATMSPERAANATARAHNRRSALPMANRDSDANNARIGTIGTRKREKLKNNSTVPM